jgi:hypothetical protein
MRYPLKISKLQDPPAGFGGAAAPSRSIRRAMVMCLLSCVFALSALGEPEALFSQVPFESTLLRRDRFDLGTDAGWQRLALAAEAARREVIGALESIARRRDELRRERELRELGAAELKDWHIPSGLFWQRRDERTLGLIVEVARRAGAERDMAARAASAEAVRELAQALRNNHRSPVPRWVPDIAMPVIMLDQACNPVGIGRSPARNLAGEGADHEGLLDPVPTTFWRPPGEVSLLDLHAGFGRARHPEHTQQVWAYDAPKAGFGGNPGIDIRAGRLKADVKFAETRSEPLAARLFWALGYHADITDHAPALEVRYDRRWLLEFNVRRDLRMTFAWLGIVPVFTQNLQRYHDPFRFIQAAVLEDGTCLPVNELRRRLFHDSNRERPEADPANYVEAFEARLDRLVTTAANVQPKDPGSQPLGPWDYNALDHADRRELRGAGLLSAWLGYYDSRWENTRLRWVTDADGSRLEHYFSDLGGSFGHAHGFASGREELPDLFAWVCTRPARRGRLGPLRARVAHFKPIADTAPFAAMTIGDARWMARLIAQLTENQLRQAIIAAGFESAPGRLLLEKLVNRRDRMIEHLRLEHEIELLRPGGLDTHFNYDPHREGPFTARLGDGTSVAAPVGAEQVSLGRLVCSRSSRSRAHSSAARISHPFSESLHLND